MNRRMNKRKPGTALLLLMLFLLVCDGCGQQEKSREKSAAGEREQWAESESAVGTALPQEGEMRSVAVAPLLAWEDPETENLAGMLQDIGGGMMVQLTAGGFMGSGIIYGAEEDCLVIVTAKHVLADAADGVQVTFVDDWETEAADFFLSEQSDLAILKVPLGEIPAQRLDKYRTANVDKPGYDSLQAGDGCIVMGSRSGVAEDAYEGTVLDTWIYMEDYGQYMIWVKAAGKPGMSGGGLFDRQGHLLGILSGRSEDGEWAAVPLALLWAELPDTDG